MFYISIKQKFPETLDIDKVATSNLYNIKTSISCGLVHLSDVSPRCATRTKTRLQIFVSKSNCNLGLQASLGWTLMTRVVEVGSSGMA